MINTDCYPYLMINRLNTHWEALSAVTTAVGITSFPFLVVVV